MKLLSSNKVHYLLIGGYAVGFHGYVRATADLDIWIKRSNTNSKRVVNTLQEFGFTAENLKAEIFMNKDQVIRMGVPPLRIEILTSISGVEFDECYETRIEENWDDLTVNIINLQKLKQNKKSSGRLKDLNDLEYLE